MSEKVFWRVQLSLFPRGDGEAKLFGIPVNYDGGGLCCTNRPAIVLPLSPDGLSLRRRYAVCQEL